jgi:hypothetical protein
LLISKIPKTKIHPILITIINPQLHTFLRNYKLCNLIVDATTQPIIIMPFIMAPPDHKPNQMALFVKPNYVQKNLIALVNNSDLVLGLIWIRIKFNAENKYI